MACRARPPHDRSGHQRINNRNALGKRAPSPALFLQRDAAPNMNAVQDGDAQQTRAMKAESTPTADTNTNACLTPQDPEDLSLQKWLWGATSAHAASTPAVPVHSPGPPLTTSTPSQDAHLPAARPKRTPHPPPSQNNSSACPTSLEGPHPDATPAKKPPRLTGPNKPSAHRERTPQGTPAHSTQSTRTSAHLRVTHARALPSQNEASTKRAARVRRFPHAGCGQAKTHATSPWSCLPSGAQLLGDGVERLALGLWHLQVAHVGRGCGGWRGGVRGHTWSAPRVQGGARRCPLPSTPSCTHPRPPPAHAPGS